MLLYFNRSQKTSLRAKNKKSRHSYRIFFSSHAITLSAIYYSADARRNEIYLSNLSEQPIAIKQCKSCIFSCNIFNTFFDVRLSFVDLAGSERYTKTQNSGERLKEAGNINTSLMTLGKCVEQLKYNQSHR